MKWLILAGRVSREFLSQPQEFLSNPSSWPQPTWAYGIVEATDRGEAFDAGLDAWGAGQLTGQQAGDELLNWYVAPLAETAHAE